jgi:DNA-binding response OmpR family regulator
VRIFLVSPRSEDVIGGFVSALSHEADELVQAETGTEALTIMDSSKPDAVIVDERIDDYGPFQLVVEVLKKDVMIQTAVITALDADEYEEKSEGLGIAMALPDQPTAEDARELIEKLKSMGL